MDQADQNGSGYLISKRSLGAGIGVLLYPVNHELGVRGNREYSHNFNQCPSDFEWQHITMTWNGLLGGTNSKLYLNGSLVGNDS